MEKSFIFRKTLSKRLGEILIEFGAINQDQLNQALSLHKDTLALHKDNGKNRISSGEALIKLGFATEEDVLRAVSAQYSFPYLPIDNYEIDPNVIRLIPAEVARKYILVPIESMSYILNIAISDPLNTQALKDVKAICKRELRTFIATPSEIQRAIDKYYNNGFDNNGDHDNNGTHKKRKYRRGIVNIHAVMVLNSSSMIGIKLENISAGGLCGLVTCSLQIDEPTELILDYPFFEDTVQVKARVAWCSKETKENSWKIGVDFDLDKDNKIAINNYIRTNSLKNSSKHLT
ncbi:MAG: PilZ domain-containing protein [Candidatus Omnitrophota bacterium]